MDLDLGALRWRSLGWRGYVALALTLVLFFVSPWYVALFFPPASTFASLGATLVSIIALRYIARTADSGDALLAGGDVTGAAATIGSIDGAATGKSGEASLGDTVHAVPSSLADSFTWSSPVVWVALFAGYTLLTNLWAASLIGSLPVTLMQISALFLFLLLWQHAGKIAPLVIPLLSLLAVALYIYGVGGALHWWPSLDAIYGKKELASVFQYHNTFGAVELALGVLGFMGGMGYRRWQWNIAGALGFIISMAAVLASASRVAWVLAPIAYILALVIVVRIKKSIWPLATELLLGIAGVGAALLGVKAIDTQQVKYIVAAFALAFVASVALAYFDKWVADKVLPQQYVRGGIAALVVIVIAAVYKLGSHVAAHSGIVARLQSISIHSVSLQERFYYYKNALPMWLNAPLFGAGGGAWSAKFQAFQTLPYWSRQVHSYFLDQLLNGGIIGFLLFMAALLLIAWRILQALRTNPGDPRRLGVAGLFIAAGVMLAHSAADFDFAFGLYQYLFWGMLGLSGAWLPIRRRVPAAVAADGATTQISAAAAALSPPTVAMATAAPAGGQVPAPHDVTAVTSAKRLAVKQAGLERAKIVWSRIGVGAIVGVGAISTVLCASLVTDQVLSQWAAKAGALGQGSYPLLSAAAAVAPYDPHVQLSLAAYYLQTSQSSGQTSLASSAWQAAQQAVADAPWDPAVQTQAAILAYELHHPRTAVNWAGRAVYTGPFNSTAYSNLMGLTMWYGTGQLPVNRAQGIATLHQVLSLYSEFQARKHVMNATLFPNEILMHRDASMQVYLGTAEYLLGHYRKSLSVMNPLLRTNRDQAAIYLYEINTVLDNAHLHPGKPSAQMKAYLANLQSNQGSALEYKYLQGLQSPPQSPPAKGAGKKKK